MADPFLYSLKKYFRQEIISKAQYDQVRANYLKNQEGLERVDDEIITNQTEIKDLRNNVGQLELQQKQKGSELKMNLLAAHKDLRANIIWEHKYTFTAPIDGTVEYLQFWNNNQFVAAGQEMFSIIPDGGQNTLRGEVFVPAIRKNHNGR